jgi:hypothetical protein
MSTLYDILGVAKDAAAKEIRRAFLNLALTKHPDKCGANLTKEQAEAANLRFVPVNPPLIIPKLPNHSHHLKIITAYETLSDAEKVRPVLPPTSYLFQLRSSAKSMMTSSANQRLPRVPNPNPHLPLGRRHLISGPVKVIRGSAGSILKTWRQNL